MSSPHQRDTSQPLASSKHALFFFIDISHLLPASLTFYVDHQPAQRPTMRDHRAANYINARASFSLDQNALCACPLQRDTARTSGLDRASAAAINNYNPQLACWHGNSPG